jgi:hypothetical protein
VGWLAAMVVGGAWAAEPTVEVPLRAPVRESDHPLYLDADDRRVAWREVTAAARRTDVMGGIRRRRVGRNTVRVLFTGAAVAEGYGTLRLVEADSDWAWALGAQAGLTGLAAALLWAEIPRARRIERAQMLDAANGWWSNHPGVR